MSGTIKAGICDSCTVGEIALVSSQLFRSRHLRLYNLSELRSPPDRYLVASRNAPVLVIHLTYNGVQWKGGNDGGAWYIGGSPLLLPAIWIPQENMKLGRVDEVLSYLERIIETTWEQDCDFPCDFYCKECHELEQRSFYQPACDSTPVPEELHPTLARLHMIRQQPDHVRSWRPTDYGADLGLIDGYLSTDKGPFHTFFFLPGCESALQEAMNWSQTHRKYDPANRNLTLAQLLKLASQGLPSNDASAAELVRAFGSMPLADYLAPCPPDTGSMLYEQFGEMTTYQEAADRLYRLCLNWDSHDPGASKEYRMYLIADLTFPLYDAIANKTSCPIPQPVQKLLRKPFPSILLGAAVSTGQPCLLWNTEDILNKALDGAEDKRSTSCQTLLTEKLEYAKESEKTYTVLFRLLVEPFALINQAADSANGSSEACQKNTDEVPF